MHSDIASFIFKKCEIIKKRLKYRNLLSSSVVENGDISQRAYQNYGISILFQIKYYRLTKGIDICSVKC